MLYAGFLAFVVLSLAGVPACLADVSLIVPGFPEQPPLSVNIVGVGADGETTYEIVPGQPTASGTSAEPYFTGTVTLVEGASNAVLEYGNSEVSLTVVESCTLADGLAGCVAAFPGQTTYSAEVTATPILVQGGGSASPGPSSTANPSASAQTTPTPGSSASGSAAATPSAPSSSPSKSASSGVKLTPATVAGLAGMLAIWGVLA